MLRWAQQATRIYVGRGVGAVRMVRELTPLSASTAHRTPRLTDLPLAGPATQRTLEPEAPVDLHVATIDIQGRVPLRKQVGAMGWPAYGEVVLTVHDGLIRFFDPARLGPQHEIGIRLTLDSRLRVQLPFGIRTATSLWPGMRLVLLAAPFQGIVAGLPVSHLVERLTGGL